MSAQTSMVNSSSNSTPKRICDFRSMRRAARQFGFHWRIWDQAMSRSEITLGTKTGYPVSLTGVISAMRLEN